MNRYRGPETEALRERWIRQGRGQGLGASYQPWIKVGEFPNRTNSYRVKSLVTDRTHHYFSAIEYRHHLVAEYAGCIDIREGYPVHPISETLALAHEEGIAHPDFAGHMCSITTDSLLTIDNGAVQYVLPRSIKWTSELRDPRVLEKLELERLAWSRRGQGWELLTERELPLVLEKNLRWIRGWQAAERSEPNSVLLDEFLIALEMQDLQQPLGTVLERTAKKLHVSKMMSIFLFRYAAWHRRFDVDLYSPLELGRPHIALRSGLGQTKNASKKRSLVSGT